MSLSGRRRKIFPRFTEQFLKASLRRMSSFSLGSQIFLVFCCKKTLKLSHLCMSVLNLKAKIAIITPMLYKVLS
jgi:hypothetical protein